MSYNLFLDDGREPHQCPEYMYTRIGPRCAIYVDEPWTVVRSHKEFVEVLNAKGLPKFVSFDHDLCLEHIKFYFEHGGHNSPPDPLAGSLENTGYDSAKYLVEYCMNNGLSVPEFAVHSMNYWGRKNIEGLLTRFKQHQDNDRARVQSTGN